MSEVIEVVDITPETSLKYQLGKVLFATVVAFAATKLAEKSFDVGVTAIKNHKTSIPTAEG